MIQLAPKDANAIHIISHAVQQRLQRDDPAAAVISVRSNGLLDAVHLAVANRADGGQQRCEPRLGQAAVDGLVGVADRLLVLGVGGGDFPAGVVEPVEAGAVVCLVAVGVLMCVCVLMVVGTVIVVVMPCSDGGMNLHGSTTKDVFDGLVATKPIIARLCNTRHKIRL